MGVDTDKKIVNDIKKGDVQSFGLLVNKYQFRIHKLVGRYIKDSSEVLDVTQEAFFKAYRAIKKFRGDSSFYTWLYRIAINTAKNHLLTYNKHTFETNMDIMEMEPQMNKYSPREFQTPENTMMSNEMEMVIFKTIDELPSELKTALTLREFEGLSYQKIAKHMKCPVGTVRSRIFRARAAVDKSVKPLLKF